MSGLSGSVLSNPVPSGTDLHVVQLVSTFSEFSLCSTLVVGVSFWERLVRVMLVGRVEGCTA
jgi:hypothetical protein